MCLFFSNLEISNLYLLAFNLLNYGIVLSFFYISPYFIIMSISFIIVHQVALFLCFDGVSNESRGLILKDLCNDSFHCYVNYLRKIIWFNFLKIINNNFHDIRSAEKINLRKFFKLVQRILYIDAETSTIAATSLQLHFYHRSDA